jgi:hypothetical protein
MVAEKKLVDAIYWEKVRRAREMDGGAKLLAGPELFDFACQWTRAGILRDHPEATPAEILDLIQQRIDILEKLEHSQ